MHVHFENACSYLRVAKSITFSHLKYPVESAMHVFRKRQQLLGGCFFRGELKWDPVAEEGSVPRETRWPWYTSSAARPAPLPSLWYLLMHFLRYRTWNCTILQRELIVLVFLRAWLMFDCLPFTLQEALQKIRMLIYNINFVTLRSIKFIP